MATTQTTYTGNGSTTNYSFTFEYLKQADVKVTLDTVATTAFTFANATTLSFTTAPANGVAIRIFRDTTIDTLSSTFFPGSAIKAEDLNENFTQNLYVTQESDTEAGLATTTANGAVTTANNAETSSNNAVATANAANTKSDAAVATSNTAETNSNTAVATANTANTNSTNAVNTANTASTNASAAVTTANAADATANTALNNSRESDGSGGFTTAISKANTALNTANSASTSATAAVSTANTANTNATAAVSTANTAAQDAATAVITANGANTNANTAVTTANTALNNSRQSDGSGGFTSAISIANSTTATANDALANSRQSDGSGGFDSAISIANSALTIANTAASDVADSVLYTSLISKTALEALIPTADGYYQVTNSTGLANGTWTIGTDTYTLSGIPGSYATITQPSGITTKLDYTHSSKTYSYSAYTVNDTEVRYLTRNVPVVTGDSTNGSGQITLNCENNSHGIKIKGPPHSAAASYTLTLPNDTGTTGQALTTNGSGVLSFSDVAGAIINQTDFAYAPTSNTLTLPTYLNIVGVSGIISSGEYYVNNIGGYAHLWFSPSDTQVKDALNTLSVGDSVTIDYTTSHGTNQFWAVTWTTTITQLPIVDTGIGNLQVKFGGGWSVNVPTSGSVSIYSAQMSNGTAPIANNQVLRYKTATSKWTVDNADVIAICDGGNFNNGSSLVQTSTTFDGGSF
jgi:hypothetical protein